MLWNDLSQKILGDNRRFHLFSLALLEAYVYKKALSSLAPREDLLRPLRRHERRSQLFQNHGLHRGLPVEILPGTRISTVYMAAGCFHHAWPRYASLRCWRETFHIAEEIPYLFRLELELRHGRMTHHDAFGERFL